MGAFETWGAGLFGDGTTPEQKALYAKYMTDDCVIDASGPTMTNTDGWKLYPAGPDGYFAWMKFLLTMDFHSFTIEGMSMINDAMTVIASFTATVKATGKTSPRITDVHRWYFKDGKISKIKFYPGNPSALDACFA